LPERKGTSPEERVRLTVDLVIFTIRDDALQVLLIERGVPPFEGRWRCPGFMSRESLEAAARRELADETGVADEYLEQLYTFSDPIVTREAGS
jgi:8-oxo-dGTP diphosphatase